MTTYLSAINKNVFVIGPVISPQVAIHLLSGNYASLAIDIFYNAALINTVNDSFDGHPAHFWIQEVGARAGLSILTDSR